MVETSLPPVLKISHLLSQQPQFPTCSCCIFPRQSEAPCCRGDLQTPLRAISGSTPGSQAPLWPHIWLLPPYTPSVLAKPVQPPGHIWVFSRIYLMCLCLQVSAHFPPSVLRPLHCYGQPLKSSPSSKTISLESFPFVPSHGSLH